MRIKVTTTPPLPPLKAWFLVPSTHASASSTACESTIAGLKSRLCCSLPTLRGFPPTSLCLSIDGFQLLDASEIGVIRDGDLIIAVEKNCTTPPHPVQHPYPENGSEAVQLHRRCHPLTQTPPKHLAQHQTLQKNPTRIPLQN
ncbi:hypothetical protein SCLCIDRAFT_793695 [Scleroderma citrinum Foug A]|uniref:Coilin n=1 Tax=Scleroderma citrinum Foug A TaxID=1036808 RepID=A0A0C2ZMG6_9AGAM|nr:hypothetical protein SCLCIDRAFT_793695 [Scleroderma citrinum Foug A]